MVVGNYLRTNINTKGTYLRFRRLLRWGEEGKKWFVSLKSICPSSSLALNVERKQLELKFLEKKAALWWAAVAVAFRKSFKLSLFKAKSTFTACLPTESMVLPEGHP
jgi:hypothetical protein